MLGSNFGIIRLYPRGSETASKHRELDGIAAGQQAI
jgi:hypothetical protein